MTLIHPSAVIHPAAQIADDVAVGPFCVIEEGVQIAAGCTMEARVVVKQATTIGQGNFFAEGSVIGGRPQHLRAGEELGALRIGHGNQIRENVTIHRGLSPDEATTLGNENLVMVGAHIAHDCHIGNNTIIANNVMLAGHIDVGDRAYLSGAVGVHQFCRIGAFAMVGGQAHIKQDVPPYVTVDGFSSLIVGLNTIGLKRNGFTSDELKQLKAAYRHIYRSGLPWKEMVAALGEQFSSGRAAAFVEFFADGKRGFVQERRTPRGATLRVVPNNDDSPDAPVRKAG